MDKIVTLWGSSSFLVKKLVSGRRVRNARARAPMDKSTIFFILGWIDTYLGNYMNYKNSSPQIFSYLRKRFYGFTKNLIWLI